MKDERLYLVHMIECAERILSYTQEGRETFLQDKKTQDFAAIRAGMDRDYEPMEKLFSAVIRRTLRTSLE